MKRLALAVFLCGTSMLGARSESNHTNYTQGLTELWRTPAALTESSVSVLFSYFASTNGANIGNLLGYHDAATDTTHNSIGVGVADTDFLFPQDVIHDSLNAADFADAAVNPLRQEISLKPTIEEYTGALSTRIPLSATLSWFATLPWHWRTHLLNTKSVGTVTPQSVEGTDVTLRDYLAGTVIQEAADNLSNKQAALEFARWTDVQQTSGLGSARFGVESQLHASEHSRIVVGTSLYLPTQRGYTGRFLFEPQLAGGKHLAVGGHLHSTAAWRIQPSWAVRIDFDGELRVSATAREMRTCALRHHLTGDVRRFGTYVLGCKHHTQRLFPLANVLTQPVDVRPGVVVDCGSMVALSAAAVEVGIGYRLVHVSAEKVSLAASWPTGTFAIADFGYQSQHVASAVGVTGYSTFDSTKNGNPDSTANLGHAITENQLMPEKAATPAQLTHTVSGLLTIRPWGHDSPGFACSGHYHFSSSFGLEGWSVGAQLFHRF